MVSMYIFCYKLGHDVSNCDYEQFFSFCHQVDCGPFFVPSLLVAYDAGWNFADIVWHELVYVFYLSRCLHALVVETNSALYAAFASFLYPQCLIINFSEVQYSLIWVSIIYNLINVKTSLSFILLDHTFILLSMIKYESRASRVHEFEAHISHLHNISSFQSTEDCILTTISDNVTKNGVNHIGLQFTRNCQ